jgi:hypothetical protein
VAALGWQFRKVLAIGSSSGLGPRRPFGGGSYNDWSGALVKRAEGLVRQPVRRDGDQLVRLGIAELLHRTIADRVVPAGSVRVSPCPLGLREHRYGIFLPGSSSLRRQSPLAKLGSIALLPNAMHVSDSAGTTGATSQLSAQALFMS